MQVTAAKCNAESYITFLLTANSYCPLTVVCPVTICYSWCWTLLTWRAGSCNVAVDTCSLPHFNWPLYVRALATLVMASFIRYWTSRHTVASGQSSLANRLSDMPISLEKEENQMIVMWKTITYPVLIAPTTCPVLTLILRRSRMGTVWFYTSTSNKKAVRPKLYTKSLTRDLKRMYSHLTLVRISINL